MRARGFAMPVRLHLDSRGGAIVELAISTVLLVPLILYSTWFADVGHWKLKLEEATIGTTMDLTAWKVNDFSRTDPNFDGYYRNAIRGVTDGATSMKLRMATSLDSAMPNRHTFESAVFVRPQALQVDCYDFPDGKPNTMTVNFTQNEGRAGQDVPELNKNTWVTCNSRARIHTAGNGLHLGQFRHFSIVGDECRYLAASPIVRSGVPPVRRLLRHTATV